MSTSKRNHFISQFYLKNFTDNNNKFYQYNKINKVFDPDAAITPNGVCWKKNFYIFIDKDDKKNDAIETILQKNEDKARNIIEKIKQLEEIIDKDLPELLIFMCLLKYRIPRFKDYFDKSKTPGLLQEFYETTKTDKEKIDFVSTFAKDRKDINKDNFYEKILNNESETYKKLFQGAMLINGLHEKNLKVFFEKNWYILSIKSEKSFITSDDPVTIIHSKELSGSFNNWVNNYEDNHTMLFPLSNKLCLLLIEEQKDQGLIFKGYNDIDDNQILEINRLLFKNSYTYVYSYEKGNILKLI